MDAIEMLMVDIAMLIATTRAAREHRTQADTAGRRAHWHFLRTEVKRATIAYLRAYAAHDPASPAEDVIAACRAAAERQMPGAIACAADLRAALESDGSLRDLTAIRHDLWRLSHIEIHLRRGGAALERSGRGRVRRLASETSRAVHARLRLAVAAYGRESMRGGLIGMHAVRRARLAATRHLDPKCVDRVNGLAKLAPAEDSGRQLLERGVALPLRYLRTDWAIPRL